MIVVLYSLLVHCFLLCTRSFVTGKDASTLSKQNRSFYFPKYRPEIFYDNKVIPEDIEVDVFLFKDQLQRLFYVVEGGHRPLSITITPCSSPVEWRLSHQVYPDAEGSYISDSWYNHVVRPNQVIPPSPTATYTGPQRQSYTTPTASAGLYMLEIKTASTEATVKIFLTTRPTSQSPYYPPLPADHRVEIVKTKRNRVLISWKGSPSRRDLQYCVSANTRANYHSLCALDSDIHGDIPSTPPSSAGFGFQWERSSRRSMVSRVTHLAKSVEPKNDVLYTCVGLKTWHMFRGLQRGRKYYFDVFVLDTDTNASSTYHGAHTALRNAVPTTKLRDGSLVNFSLDSSNGYAVSSKYQFGKTSGHILLFVQSCTGPGPITITVSKTGSGSEVLTESVMDVKTLEIRQAEAGATYILTLKSSTKHPRHVRVWISGKKQSFPFPVLPRDKNVKVFDTLITCDSITIGWRVSPDEKVKYCIFRSTARNDDMKRSMAEPQNFCQASPDPGNDRKVVLCRRYHRFSKRRFNNVIMQRVKGLERNTTYLFEVQVNKVNVNGRTLPYEQVWATTSSSCSKSHTNR